MTFYNKIAGQKVQRIEALSDGVFAIAMTILVFDLKDPIHKVVKSDMQLLASLTSTLPKLLTYFLSFMTLGIFWTGQSTQFNYIEKYDRNLNWCTLFFLLFVAILPFTTGILSDHINNKVSIGLYWLNLLAMGLLLLLHWNYVYKNNYLTIPIPEKEAINKAIRNRIIIAQSLYTLGALLCFINTYISILFIMLVELNYALGIFDKKGNKE